MNFTKFLAFKTPKIFLQPLSPFVSTRKLFATAESGSGGNFKNIMVEKTGKIYKITFNRPKKYNALTPEMYSEIIAAMKESEKSDSLLTVFTGNGDYYCSGNDLSNFAGDVSQINQMASSARKILENYVSAYIDHPKPMVALVNGPAIGISVTVMGLFDIVYASDKSSFYTPFANLGQSPEGVSSFTFPQIMGIAKATEFLLFDKKITPQEAHRLGLVTEVFPSATFVEETSKKIKTISELPTESVLHSRALIRKPYKDIWHRVNTEECNVIEERWKSKECLSAIMNFFSRAKK